MSTSTSPAALLVCAHLASMNGNPFEVQLTGLMMDACIPVLRKVPIRDPLVIYTGDKLGIGRDWAISMLVGALMSSPFTHDLSIAVVGHGYRQADRMIRLIRDKMIDQHRDWIKSNNRQLWLTRDRKIEVYSYHKLSYLHHADIAIFNDADYTNQQRHISPLLGAVASCIIIDRTPTGATPHFQFDSIGNPEESASRMLADI